MTRSRKTINRVATGSVYICFLAGIFQAEYKLAFAFACLLILALVQIMNRQRRNIYRLRFFDCLDIPFVLALTVVILFDDQLLIFLQNR